MSYSIRMATAADVSALPDIERAAGRLFPPEDVPERMREGASSIEELEAARDLEMLLVAASEDGVPVGFAYLVLMENHIHLEELDVHPDHGKRGIGARLVKAVLGWARDRGYPAVTLTTFSHLPWNAPFYERMGFRRLAETELSEELRAELDWEAAEGLDRANRVAMRYELPPIRTELS